MKSGFQAANKGIGFVPAASETHHRVDIGALAKLIHGVRRADRLNWNGMSERDRLDWVQAKLAEPFRYTSVNTAPALDALPYFDVIDAAVAFEKLTIRESAMQTPAAALIACAEGLVLHRHVTVALTHGNDPDMLAAVRPDAMPPFQTFGMLAGSTAFRQAGADMMMIFNQQRGASLADGDEYWKDRSHALSVRFDAALARHKADLLAQHFPVGVPPLRGQKPASLNLKLVPGGR